MKHSFCLSTLYFPLSSDFLLFVRPAKRPASTPLGQKVTKPASKYGVPLTARKAPAARRPAAKHKVVSRRWGSRSEPPPSLCWCVGNPLTPAVICCLGPSPCSPPQKTESSGGREEKTRGTAESPGDFTVRLRPLPFPHPT